MKYSYNMQQTIPLLDLMYGNTIRFSKSDQKLANIIRDNPQSIIQMSIANLAKTAQVSEPTVNRFCHKLHCDGYPDFKLKLAQEISLSGQLFVDNLQQSDSGNTIISKVLHSVQNNIQILAHSLDTNSLEHAATAITQCNSVNFFGMGASSSVALDAQHKFFRFGIPVVAHTDFINQRMICSMLNEKDVAIFISYTGRTQALIENARIAKASKAKIIGITRHDSVLADECDITLNVTTTEDTDLFTPMTSRLIHLIVVDMLACSVALKLGNRIKPHIKAIKKNLVSTRDGASHKPRHN